MNADPFAPFAALERWVLWRAEARGAAGKPTKIPYDPRRLGYKADATDPRSWGTRSEAAAVLPRFLNGAAGGIGIVLGDIGADTYLAGLDLDSSVSDGLISDWAAELLAAAPSYAEVSPSLSGIKTWFLITADMVRPFLACLGVEPDNWGLKRGLPGLSAADHGAAIELYTSGRFFTVTAMHWGRSPDAIRLLTAAELDELARLIPPARTGKRIGRDTSRSGIAFRKARALIAQGCSYDEMVAALRADPELADWVAEKGAAAGGRELKRLWERARPEIGGGVSLGDFWAYMPQHNYIYAPTRELWPGGSLDARLPWIPVLEPNGAPKLNKKGNPLEIPPSTWLDQNKPVEQMTWAPGEPMIIEERLISQGGWIERTGVSCFNLYRPPILLYGEAKQAARWTQLVAKIYPDDATHIIRWLAHRVQYPADKVNHVLVLGGLQGIGKDSLIEPVKRAAGPWNVAEPSPTQLMGRFNGFAKSVILRVSEAHDLGDVDRYAFYEHLKVYAAAPPDVLRIDEKHLREYNILNCCAVLITTNHKTDGIYLPADDRRHYVAWSTLTKADFTDDYWDELWDWYDSGGDGHVAAYLAELDLGDFNPKAPPPKTEAFWTIVNAGRSPEDAELADCLDHLGNPDVVTVGMVLRAAEMLFPPPPPVSPGVAIPKSDSFADWLKDRRNRRNIPHRFEACGYVPVRNPDDIRDGQWKIKGKRQTVYARQTLTLRAQIAAAQDLQRR